MRLSRIIFIICGFIPFCAAALESQRIELGGNWAYRLTGAPSSIPGEGEIVLPNTLDNARKTIYNPESDNTSQLRREFSFTGEATYSKEIIIPDTWEDKAIFLNIERTKPSRVYVNRELVAKNSRISASQKYDLSGFLTPGKHTLEIVVNNADSIPPIIARSSNAVAESTQTNWNGILGDFYLEAKNPFHVGNINVAETPDGEAAKITLDFSQRAPAGHIIKGRLNGREFDKARIKTGSSSLELELPLNGVELWSLGNPKVHQLEFEIIDNWGETVDLFKTQTGFRTFKTDGSNFLLNGKPVFLRGTVNAAVFPATAYAPTDIEPWIEYFTTLKEYGLNHVRFHSWTPPAAAFEAADQTGIIILTELPIWGELDRDLAFHNRFLTEDLRGIIDDYSIHPSFALFSTGNELWGDISLMGEYMKNARSLNPRILSTYGSNVYLGMNGRIGEEDFVLAAKTGDDIDKWVRGSVSFADSDTGGYFNSTYPERKSDYSGLAQAMGVPVISHEVGQYQSYPDFSEIELYTGPLKPDNLMEFKKRAVESGTFSRWQRFLEASGKWAAKLYKAEMEKAQRSKGIGGFELFGIQDYPGQGTALIGILNPFMQSKGFVTPEEWKESCDDVMVLAEFPKYVFSEGEKVEIPVCIVNYSENADPIGKIKWETEILEGEINVKPGYGILENENVTFTLPSIDNPEKMTLTLASDDGKVKNSYDFYVYPRETKAVKNVTVTDNVAEALILLDQGQRVILCPDSTTVAQASVGPLFTTDFWNYRMFRTICDEMGLEPSPGTLGLYINSQHSALNKFPTDSHTDWQWYAIVANSHPLIIDRLPKDFTPIVEVIDNVERNFRLALMFECKVEKGKLLVISANLKQLEKYPEGRWLLQSVKEYAASKEFNPALTLSADQLVNLLTKPSAARRIKELRNETYNSHWD